MLLIIVIYKILEYYIHYTIQLNQEIFVVCYGFLSSAKNMVKNIGKNKIKA